MLSDVGEERGLGQIVICPNCKDVHLAVDSISIRITQKAFLAPHEMMQEALRHPYLRSQRNEDHSYSHIAALFSRA